MLAQLDSYTKVNLKCIEDLNVSHETIKLLEENISKNLLNINMSNFFLNASLWARETTTTKKNRWDYVKLKTSVQQRTPAVEQKGILQYGRTFVNASTDKGLTSKIYKELIHLNTQKTNKPIKNGWSV